MGSMFDYLLHFSVIRICQNKILKRHISRIDRDVIKPERPWTNKLQKTPDEYAPTLGSTVHGGLRNAKKNAKPRLEMTWKR